MELAVRLRSLVAEHGVPGAAAAVAIGGEVVSAAAGVLNTATGVEATTDSVFQIGSITKTFTATLALTLVDEGRVELDTRVADVLPDFSVADPDVSRELTLRHLMTHTSGLDSDLLVDVGWGDDALARYTEHCRDLRQSTPLGATWSYCNSGFVLLGRVVEVLTGTTYDGALRARILDPLGMTHSATLPDELLRHRVAYGHIGGTPLPTWSMGRAWGPAGATLCCSAGDLLHYGRTVVGGTSGLLAPATLAQALEPAVPVRGIAGVRGWGLGWCAWDWGGAAAYGHDGGTVGQSALLRVLPDRDLAVAVLVCSRNGAAGVVEGILELVAEAAGVTPPAPPRPAGDAVAASDLGAHLGTYERTNFRLVLFAEGGRVAGRVELGGPLAETVGAPSVDVTVRPGPAGDVLASMPGVEGWLPLVFYRGDDGSEYATFGPALRRIA